MNASINEFFIRRFKAEDAERCWHLFHDTVRRINSRDYTPSQVNAWADASIDTQAWFHRFDANFGFVAELQNRLVGFADVSGEGYLDRLFVHADHLRKGIATMLMNAIEMVAVEHGCARIYTHASITAKPFFLSCGFVVVREQTVECRGAQLNNFVMQRTLAEK